VLTPAMPGFLFTGCKTVMILIRYIFWQTPELILKNAFASINIKVRKCICGFYQPKVAENKSKKPKSYIKTICPLLGQMQK
jgi:hypothetical protein